MNTFNVLLVHGGESPLDPIKDEIIMVLPELEERKNVKTTDRAYLVERILEEGKRFDAIIFTEHADITKGVLKKILHSKEEVRPREIVIIGKRKGLSFRKSEVVFIVNKLSGWKSNLYYFNEEQSLSPL